MIDSSTIIVCRGEKKLGLRFFGVPTQFIGCYRGQNQSVEDCS